MDHAAIFGKKITWLDALAKEKIIVQVYEMFSQAGDPMHAGFNGQGIERG